MRTGRRAIARTIAETYSHRWEVAGGGGYMRFRSGQYLQKNNDVTFWMTGTYFLNLEAGDLADVRGPDGKREDREYTVQSGDLYISTYPFMGGVAYRVYAKEKLAVTVTGEGGYGVVKFDGGTKTIPSKYLGLWQSTTRPAFSVGVNLDYNFYPNLAR